MSDPLTKDEVRPLLRECVTVVKSGEVLVIRGLENWTVQQMREVQDVLNAMHADGTVPFRSLIVPGAMEEGLKFAIREGGKTVGAGVITKILADTKVEAKKK